MAKKKTAKRKKPQQEASQKREIFAQFVAAGKTKAEAYRLAGYKSTNSQCNANEASRLSRRPEVKARIEELKAETAAEFKYTRAQAMKELESAQKIAMGAPVPMPDGTTKELQTPNPAAICKAIEQKIKLAGIEPPSQHDLNVSGGIHINLPGTMSREEWEAEAE